MANNTSNTNVANSSNVNTNVSNVNHRSSQIGFRNAFQGGYGQMRGRIKAIQRGGRRRTGPEVVYDWTKALIGFAITVATFILLFFIIGSIWTYSTNEVPSWMPAPLAYFFGEYIVQRVPSQVVEATEEISPGFCGLNRLATNWDCPRPAADKDTSTYTPTDNFENS